MTLRFEDYVSSAQIAARGLEDDPEVVRIAKQFDIDMWDYVDNKLESDDE